jgi:hypothetical protein
MIGTRAVLSATIAVVAVGAVFAGRMPDPGAAVAAEKLVGERAAATVAALDELEDALQPGLDVARHGAALVVAGDDAPGPVLEDASDQLRDAEEEAGEVRRAVDALNGAIAAWQAEAPTIGQQIERGEVGSIAAQLQATAPDADAFAEMRRRADGMIATLESALAALDAGDLGGADRLIAGARSDHDALTAWENDLLTLPIWIDTTDAMISDLETIVDATRTGDDAAAAAAATAFAARGNEAQTADRALRIAMAEGGAAVTAPALSRLAGMLGAIERLRAEAEAIAPVANR